MLLSLLILLPLFGTLVLFILYNEKNENLLKISSLIITIINLFLSLIIWFLFDNSNQYFQFIQEHYTIGHYDIYLGLDGLSIYFVLLTTLIAPISIISNWKSINSKTCYFLIIILLLESALLLIYSVLDILMFYIFFESILAPLFILIGFFGSTDKLRASFYFFLYTFLGSLFMLLSIISVSSLTGSTDMDIIYKTNYSYITQIFLFMGIFVAFAVKTPVIFLNTWLLKAHVESPLSGSVILAAIVLKLSLYGVFRLILPLVPKAFIFYTHIIFVICVITILYASFSTIRTIDVKELIAYSSVSHAAVYFAGILSNVIQGIQGGILLGLAHGFVSSGLFISGGGVLYDRSSTRTINYYGGLAQVMPIFSVIFFILCLGNCGAPLTLNFVGEFMSLYGIFERLPLAGILAASSIVLSAVYTIFMFNRIIFGGVFKGFFTYLPDLNKREYSILLILVIFTVALGIYPSIILDSLNYSVSNLLFTLENASTVNDVPEPWGLFFQDSASPLTLPFQEKLEELHNNIMFYLAVILFAVSWIVLSIMLKRFFKKEENILWLRKNWFDCIGQLCVMYYFYNLFLPVWLAMYEARYGTNDASNLMFDSSFALYITYYDTGISPPIVDSLDNLLFTVPTDGTGGASSSTVPSVEGGSESATGGTGGGNTCPLCGKDKSICHCLDKNFCRICHQSIALGHCWCDSNSYDDYGTQKEMCPCCYLQSVKCICSKTGARCVFTELNLGKDEFKWQGKGCCVKECATFRYTWIDGSHKYIVNKIYKCVICGCRTCTGHKGSME